LLYASLAILPTAVLGSALRRTEDRSNCVHDVALNILRVNAVSDIRREPYINALAPEHTMQYSVT